MKTQPQSETPNERALEWCDIIDEQMESISGALDKYRAAAYRGESNFGHCGDLCAVSEALAQFIKIIRQ